MKFILRALNKIRLAITLTLLTMDYCFRNIPSIIGIDFFRKWYEQDRLSAWLAFVCENCSFQTKLLKMLWMHVNTSTFATGFYLIFHYFVSNYDACECVFCLRFRFFLCVLYSLLWITKTHYRLHNSALQVLRLRSVSASEHISPLKLMSPNRIHMYATHIANMWHIALERAALKCVRMEKWKE